MTYAGEALETLETLACTFVARLDRLVARHRITQEEAHDLSTPVLDLARLTSSLAGYIEAVAFMTAKEEEAVTNGRLPAIAAKATRRRRARSGVPVASKGGE